MDHLQKINHELRRYRDYDNTKRIRLFLLKNDVTDLSRFAASLSISDLDVLSAVAHYRDSRISEIVDHLSLTQGAVSKIVNKLSGLRLIEKYHQPNNKKDTYLKVTTVGDRVHTLHAEYHKEMDQQLCDFSKHFTDEQLVLVGNFLSSVNHIREGT
ncbi:MarR family winged helix-turn-helix transcriptional regulator [Oenococcus sicerae]|uniref:MarR family winged helix-turn-helix transcriptional regulator n=1 Tax=Oenococcus sicerae TaxID=2203724 RepID=UPI0039E7D4B6